MATHSSILIWKIMWTEEPGGLYIVHGVTKRQSWAPCLLLAEDCSFQVVFGILVVKVKVKLLSHIWLFATPWTVAYHVPPSMGFSRQEYWSGLPSPSPGDLPNPGSLYLITMTILMPIMIHNLPFLKFIFNRKIIALQYCVGFCQTSTESAISISMSPPS